MSTATTPTHALTTTPRFDRIALDRWEHWEAATMIWLQQWHRSPIATKVLGPIPTLERLRQDHRYQLSSLLARGIPLRVIRRLALDDPRLDRDAAEAHANDYLQRRLQRSTKEQ